MGVTTFRTTNRLILFPIVIENQSIRLEFLACVFGGGVIFVSPALSMRYRKRPGRYVNVYGRRVWEYDADLYPSSSRGVKRTRDDGGCCDGVVDVQPVGAAGNMPVSGVPNAPKRQRGGKLLKATEIGLVGLGVGLVSILALPELGAAAAAVSGIQAGMELAEMVNVGGVLTEAVGAMAEAGELAHGIGFWGGMAELKYGTAAVEAVAGAGIIGGAITAGVGFGVARRQRRANERLLKP